MRRVQAQPGYLLVADNESLVCAMASCARLPFCVCSSVCFLRVAVRYAAAFARARVGATAISRVNEALPFKHSRAINRRYKVNGSPLTTCDLRLMRD